MTDTFLAGTIRRGITRLTTKGNGARRPGGLRPWMVAYLRMDEGFEKQIPERFVHMETLWSGREVRAWDDDEVGAYIADAIDQALGTPRPTTAGPTRGPAPISW